MSNILKTLAAGSAAAGDYQISRSLRFNSADSAYLSRTPASAGNRRTWTWSGWVKRSAISRSGVNSLFGRFVDGDQHTVIRFDSTDKLDIRFTTSTVVYQLDSVAVFRDASAWYHIVIAVDTTQATAGNRVKAYANGEQLTLSGTSWPLNGDTFINTTAQHEIGNIVGVATAYLDGYLADINFIDGQALTPSSFGEVDETTGVWKPIAYAGSYGTTGFRLDFSDNSSTTALGYDAAGSNDWTPNNFSVTAGAGNDSLVDTPTPYGTDTGAGGEVRGNYATLNPLDQNGANTFANGNLDVVVTNVTQAFVGGSIAVSSGKWYWEVLVTTSLYSPVIGVSDINKAVTLRSWKSPNGWGYNSNGSIYNSNAGTAYGNTYTVNDVIGVALDMDNGKVYWSKNGTWQNSGDPEAGTNAGVSSGIAGKTIAPYLGNLGTGGVNYLTANFGQRPFAYTAPSGFKALVTTNLPEPTVVQGDDYFNTVLYTGNGSTQSITGVGFQPDFVWIKERSSTSGHQAQDAVRGTGAVLYINETTAEYTGQTNFVTSFDSDGFSVGNGGSCNESAQTYVGWNWKANGAGSLNELGTISSTVSANTTAGISIVTYTNASSGTVGHGLGVAPKMVIYKDRTNGSNNWVVLHTALASMNDNYLVLNTTGASASGLGLSAAPTSSVISTSTALGGSGNAFVAYCFAEVEGFSKFGSYTGNGSADGPFVYTGFRPALVLLKPSSTTGDWAITDNKRQNPFNVVNGDLTPNANFAEGTFGFHDFVSNGFKARATNPAWNTNGVTYIYAAFAENPFKNSLAR